MNETPSPRPPPSRHFPSAAVVGLALALAGVLVVPTVAAHPKDEAVEAPNVSPNGEPETTLRLHLEARTETEGPFLSKEPDASAVERFAASSDPTSGARAIVGEVTEGVAPAAPRGPTYVFELPEALPNPLYPNVTAPLLGSLFWRSTASENAFAESYHLRIELWSGGARVGGLETSREPAADYAAWNELQFALRPEVEQLQAGDRLQLRIVRVGGLSDLFLGTGGNHQSFVEIRHFLRDPLAGTLFIEEGGGLLAIDDGLEPEPGESGDAPDRPLRQWLVGIGSTGFGLAALFVLGVRRRRPPGHHVGVLVGLILLAPSLGGCLGDDSARGPSVAALAPADVVDVEERDDLRERGVGAIEGAIRDEAGLPVRTAHVALLGTRSATDADARGRFVLNELAAGTYTLRVDAFRFQPHEISVSVSVGAATRITLNLTHSDPRFAYEKPHPHGADWGDETQLVVQDVTWVPFWGGVDDAALGGQHWACPPLWQACEAGVPIDVQRTVLPGTRRVEIVLDWDPGLLGAETMGLTVFSERGWGRFLPRPPGEPFRMPIWPNEADPGHQPFTSWIFRVELPGPWSPSVPLVHAGTAVRFTATLHKGTVPFEPAHRDFWGDARELPLVDHALLRRPSIEDDVLAPGETLLDLPSVAYGWYLFDEPRRFVPPGTVEIRGRLQWSGPLDPTSAVSWGLAYHPANLSPSSTAYRKATVTASTPTSIDFTIPLEPDEADGFYALLSNWWFLVDDNDQPAKGVNAAYGTGWFLSAQVIRGLPGPRNLE